jgi:hypothetical protein
MKSKKMIAWRILLFPFLVIGLISFLFSPFIIVNAMGVTTGWKYFLLSVSGVIFNLWLIHRLNPMKDNEII